MPKKINIRAAYKNGSLTPLDYVDIEKGDVVSLTIEVDPKLSKGNIAARGNIGGRGLVGKARPGRTQVYDVRFSQSHRRTTASRPDAHLINHDARMIYSIEPKRDWIYGNQT